MRILKILIISIVIVSILLISLFLILNKVTKIEWGNTVNFENEMKMKIDSLEISVCDTKTIFITTVNEDKLDQIGGNMKTPKNGYPCPVKIKIYTLGKIIELESDKKFDCNNCDIYHIYKLTKEKAFYSYIN